MDERKEALSALAFVTDAIKNKTRRAPSHDDEMGRLRRINKKDIESLGSDAPAELTAALRCLFEHDEARQQRYSEDYDAARAEHFESAFMQVVTELIDPIAETSPELARRSYLSFHDLLFRAYLAGESDYRNRIGVLTRLETKGDGRKGGNANAIASQQGQAERWSAEALEFAKQWVTANPRYSQEKLATEINFRLDDKAPSIGQIKAVIARWQRDGLLPRKQAKPPSPAG